MSCDKCYESLDEQEGFYAYCGYWTCLNFGPSDGIGKREILFDNNHVGDYSDGCEEVPKG